MKTILIIEDDSDLARGIAFTFEKDGYRVVCAGSIAAGNAAFLQNDIDLAILDIGLPDGSGLTLCNTIRTKSAIPIIMLTACNMETDEVSSFLAGADDYITKPFSLSVLRARVSALFRRIENAHSIIATAGFRLDTKLCKLFTTSGGGGSSELSESEIPISTTEFRILQYMMTNAGQVLSKEQILSALWDNSGEFVDENVLPVNISRLRAKLEADPKNPRTIKTVRGIGYLWVI